MFRPIKLRQGAGSGNPKDGVCLMQAVDWFAGADMISDHPTCASPVLCVIGIQLNDLAPNQAARDRLWPLVWQLLNSRDPVAEQARAEHIVREVAHRIVAPIFERIASDHSAALRAANSMPEIEKAAARAAARAAAVWTAAAAAQAAAVWTAEAAQAAAVWTAEAARAAAVWTAAAAARAAAAWTAAAAARAAAAWTAEAARAAAWAAVAARAAAEEAAEEEAAEETVWNELRSIFIEAIALGKHDEPDPVYEPRHAKLLELIED